MAHKILLSYWFEKTPEHTKLETARENKNIANLFKEMQIFKSKLDMKIEQMKTGDCTHFPSLSYSELDEIKLCGTAGMFGRS